MSEHLSHDQISRWIMGQATSEEQKHGLDCAQCSAEMNRFRESITTFRDAMQEWSVRGAVPKLERTPDVSSGWRMRPPVMRWALLAATFAILIGIPIYQYENNSAIRTESASNSTLESAISTSINNDDVLLMESVSTHLSRPLPMPMERVMALLPVQADPAGLPDGSTDGAEGNGRKEIR